MKHTICVYSSKGGVGKTTFALNLAYYLTQYKSIKTLLIDMDPQNSVAGVLGEAIGAGVSEWLSDEVQLSTIIHKNSAGFDHIHTGIQAVEDTIKYTQNLMNLKNGFLPPEFIETLYAEYDCIIFDTPPGFNPMANAAMGISDTIVGVVEADPTSYATLELMENIIKKITYKSKKEIFFIVNMVNFNDLSVDFEKLFKYIFEEKHLASLPYDSSIKTSTANCESVFISHAEGAYASFFKEMADNLLKRLGYKDHSSREKELPKKNTLKQIFLRKK